MQCDKMNNYSHDSIEEFSLNKMKIKLATDEDLENLDFDCGDDDLMNLFLLITKIILLKIYV